MQLGENSFLAGRPDQVTAQAPRLEIEQSRNVLHSQPKAEIRVVVSIYLYDLDVSRSSGHLASTRRAGRRRRQ
jgi:hypothetical protein